MPKTNKKFPRGVEVTGGIIIENPQGKILLVKSKKWNNKWTFPGGHIEPGEKIEEALVREAKEEVGLALKSEGIIVFGELINPKGFHRPAHFIYFDIYCKSRTSDVKLDLRESSEYQWATPPEALGMDLAEGFDETILKFIKFRQRK